MNREIKFRAFMINDKFPKGKMYYPGDTENYGHEKEKCLVMNQFGNLFNIDANPINYNTDIIRTRIANDIKSIMQYTGLKDKNGKEIYENDLLTYYTENCDKSFDGKKKAVVKWDNKKCGFFPFVEDAFICNHYCYLFDFEVIGNIFENPELLKT